MVFFQLLQLHTFSLTLVIVCILLLSVRDIKVSEPFLDLCKMFTCIFITDLRFSEHFLVFHV